MTGGELAWALIGGMVALVVLLIWLITQLGNSSRSRGSRAPSWGRGSTGSTTYAMNGEMRHGN